MSEILIQDELNLDKAEVKKFSQHAAMWWSINGPMRTLHQVNPLRLNFVLSHSLLKDKKLVDIGCGGGIFSEALAEQGAEVFGIDANPQLIKIAKLHLLESLQQVHYENCLVEDFAQQNPQQFDVITCMEMLEHVPDVPSIIQAISTLLKPGGKVFFSTLNRNAQSWLKAIVGAEYIFNLIPRGTHRYDRFIKPSELSKIARDFNLNLIDLKGISYSLLDDKFFMTDDVSVNYMACFMKK